MASSPPYLSTSPPYPAPSTLPKKRPSPSTANPSNPKRRKPSASAASGYHPLRQTSFPPPEHAQSSRTSSFSPTVDTGSAMSVTGTSSVGGRGRGRKRGAKGRGASDARSATGTRAGSTVASGRGRDSASASAVGGAGMEREEDEGDEEEVEGNEDAVMEGGGKEDEAALKMEREHLAMLVSAFNSDQAHRYDVWRRVKLKKETVRKITNQTLSQSVGPPIITTVNGYTKIFIGELIERARVVQSEWLAASLVLPTGEPRASSPSSFSTLPPHSDGHTNGEPTTDPTGNQSPSASGRTAVMVDERDRGPLTPDHLREALRRYRKDRQGGGAGFQGLSLQGREGVASRAGGRRLFR